MSCIGNDHTITAALCIMLMMTTCLDLLCRHASEMGGQGNSSAFGDRPTQQAAVQSFLKNYDKVSHYIIHTILVTVVVGWVNKGNELQI